MTLAMTFCWRCKWLFLPPPPPPPVIDCHQNTPPPPADEVRQSAIIASTSPLTSTSKSFVCVCFVHAAMTDPLRSCALHVLFRYEWVYRADIEIEKVFFVNRVSFEAFNQVFGFSESNGFSCRKRTCSSIVCFVSCHSISLNDIY